MSEHRIIKDRGNIKWSTMMLPEHREALIVLQNSIEDVVEPSHDEDQLAELSDMVSKAIHEQEPVLIKYYKDRHIHSIVGTITGYKSTSSSIQVNTPAGSVQIPVKHVMEIQAD